MLFDICFWNSLPYHTVLFYPKNTFRATLLYEGWQGREKSPFFHQVIVSNLQFSFNTHVFVISA